jgi:heme-degrading monooxygenase HmoA
VSEEIFAIAVVKVEAGHEDEVIQILHDLYQVMTAKSYSRNILYRDSKDPRRLVNLRYWTSEEARSRAQEDPDVHRSWVRLGQVATVDPVFEQLDVVTMERD